jgi:hypothetical protein
MRVLGKTEIKVMFQVNDGKSIVSKAGKVLSGPDALRYIATDAVFKHWLFNTNRTIVGNSIRFPVDEYLDEFGFGDARAHLDYISWNGKFFPLGKMLSCFNAYCEAVPLLRAGISPGNAKFIIESNGIHVTEDINKAEAIEIISNINLMKRTASLYKIVGLGLRKPKVRPDGTVTKTRKQ